MRPSLDDMPFGQRSGYWSWALNPVRRRSRRGLSKLGYGTLARPCDAPDHVRQLASKRVDKPELVKKELIKKRKIKAENGHSAGDEFRSDLE